MKRLPIPYHWRQRLAGVRIRLRMLSADHRPLPGAVIIGAQKSGTSTLLGNLLQQPAAAPPLRKEVRFFDFAPARGERFYRAHFPFQTRPPRLAMEASPDYMIHPAVAGRMAAMLPDARLLAILRNPVNRAYSHFQHSLRRGHERLGFEAALAAEAERLDGELDRITVEPGHSLNALHRHSYLLRGRYADQLERFLAVYPRERLLVVRAEDYFTDPQAMLRRVFAFLDLPPFAPAMTVRKKRIGLYEPMQSATRAWLQNYFRAHNERLSALLGEPFGWEE